MIQYSDYIWHMLSFNKGGLKSASNCRHECKSAAGKRPSGGNLFLFHLYGVEATQKYQVISCEHPQRLSIRAAVLPAAAALIAKDITAGRKYHFQHLIHNVDTSQRLTRLTGCVLNPPLFSWVDFI